MTFAANVVSVLIASPSDTAAERDAVEQAIHQWNADRAERQGVVLMPLRWEVNAVPVMSDTPQGAINKQLLDRADIVIGVFFARLGQATKRYPSGTVEEIIEANEVGKPVHVYFSSADVPINQIDIGQLTHLKDVKADLRIRALYGEFASIDELKMKVRSALEHDLAELNLSTPAAPAREDEKPALRATYESRRKQYQDSKGRMKYRTVGTRVVVINSGNAVAREVRLSLEPVDGGALPARMDGWERPRDIAPNGGTSSYPLILMMGVAREYEATLTWTSEFGDEETTSHSLSFA
ncbi:hypothetical protein [Oerskovia enterophila]|uniref:DUF4062 domain-containing protein n=1 Tax=Oerskovia enterophila TaxID=43678 RepID=A0ABX2Y159_9CELL|nr:hypothetical protein [Oerskovia enterophila]OCI30289.1 hypothetical protein OERS_30270 [Oerskovia enterophila]